MVSRNVSLNVYHKLQVYLCRKKYRHLPSRLLRHYSIAITKPKVELSPAESDSDSGCLCEIYSFNLSSQGKLFTFVFLSSPRARDEESEKVASTSFVAAKKLFRLIETWNVFTCKCERKCKRIYASMYRALMIWGVGGDDKNMPRHFSAYACCSFLDRQGSEAENFTREIRNHVEINYVLISYRSTFPHAM